MAAASVPCYQIGDGCIFQVPHAVRKDDEGKNSSREIDYIAVLDSSGSMDRVWGAVARSINKLQEVVANFHTVTFSTLSCRTHGTLSEDLYNHGGGGTNIREGIEGLKEVVTELRKKGSDSFLVIFVSDGYDTHGNTPDSLMEVAAGIDASGMEFTTVGVGEQFPTHLSMALRNALHTGRVTLPNLTLVKETTDFEGVFDNLREGILESNGATVTVIPPVQTAPWIAPTHTIFEKTWVQLDEMAEKIELEGTELSLVPSSWMFSTGEAVMKQWINMLHAMAACGHDVKDMARVSVGFAQQIATKVTEARKAEAQAEAATGNGASNRCPSVYQRLRKKMRKIKFDLSALEKELNNLANGDALSALSDADLAQRLAIGMKEGKHHKRAMQWKGVAAWEFASYLTKFQILMTGCLHALRNGPEDENRSAVSLESNRDVLLQEDLSEAIRELPSQYFLVDCVPVVGQPVVIKVTDGSMINPWLVKVESVSRHTPMLDTCTILGLADEEGMAHMSLGGGQSEAVNAVCPLFTPEVAKVIGPFMRSKLYQMLMTHVVCKNIDTIDPDSHPALMAALVCNLLGEPRSTWRDELIGKVVDTMKGIYLERDSFKNSIVYLKDTPALAMVTDSPDLPTKCQSLSKPLLLTMCMTGELDARQKAAIIQELHLEHIGRALGGGRQYSDWFKTSGGPTDGVFGGGLEQLGLDVKKFATWPSFRKAIAAAVDELVKGEACATKAPADLDTSQATVELKKEKLNMASKRSQDPVNFEILKAFAEWVIGEEEEELPSIPMEAYVVHACIYTKSYDRAANEVLDMEAARKLIIEDAINLYYKDRKAIMKQRLISEGEALYNKHYDDVHQDAILPMTWAEICEERARLGLQEVVDEKALGYDSKTGMCKNACMAPKCDFYLMPTRSLGCHLQRMREAMQQDDGEFVEAFHRCIFDMRHCPDSDIEKACISGKYLQRPPPMTFEKAFQGDRGITLRKEIAVVKEKYIQMYG